MRSLQSAVPIERPFTAVQWGVLAGSLFVGFYSVLGMIINPDFATGDEATTELVLGVDMNGWHALSGFLVTVPGLVATRQVRLSELFAPVAAIPIAGVGIWLLLTEHPAGVLYLPNTAGDLFLHLFTAALFMVGWSVHRRRGNAAPA